MNKLIAVYTYNDTYNFSTGIESFDFFNEAMNRKKETISFLNTIDFIKIKLSFNLFLNNTDLTNNQTFYILQGLKLFNNKIWLGKPGTGTGYSMGYFLFDSFPVNANTLVNYKKEFIINLPSESFISFTASGALSITTQPAINPALNNIITIEEID